MTEEQIVYRSSNGDDWSLGHDAAGQRVVVHRANLASGGTITRMPVSEFLQRNSGSPEAGAVRLALTQTSTD